MLSFDVLIAVLLVVGTTLGSPAPKPKPLDVSSMLSGLNVSSNVKAAIDATIPSIAQTSLSPVAEENPNLLPVLIYQGTPDEPCTNIGSMLKPTQYVWPDDFHQGDKIAYPHCWDFGLQNITCLIIGRVGRTYADLNGKVESNCGPDGPSEFGQLGIYNDTFGNAYTWGPQNGGSIRSFSFAPYLNRPLPPSLQPKPVPWP